MDIGALGIAKVMATPIQHGGRSPFVQGLTDEQHKDVARRYTSGLMSDSQPAFLPAPSLLGGEGSPAERENYFHAKAAYYNFAINLFGGLVCAGIYFNYRLFEPYAQPIIWAGLCSIALRGLRDNLVGKISSRLEIEDLDSSSDEDSPFTAPKIPKMDLSFATPAQVRFSDASGRSLTGGVKLLVGKDSSTLLVPLARSIVELLYGHRFWQTLIAPGKLFLQAYHRFVPSSAPQTPSQGGTAGTTSESSPDGADNHSKRHNKVRTVITDASSESTRRSSTRSPSPSGSHSAARATAESPARERRKSGEGRQLSPKTVPTYSSSTFKAPKATRGQLVRTPLVMERSYSSTMRQRKAAEGLSSPRSDSATMESPSISSPPLSTKREAKFEKADWSDNQVAVANNSDLDEVGDAVAKAVTNAATESDFGDQVVSPKAVTAVVAVCTALVSAGFFRLTLFVAVVYAFTALIWWEGKDDEDPKSDFKKSTIKRLAMEKKATTSLKPKVETSGPYFRWLFRLCIVNQIGWLWYSILLCALACISFGTFFIWTGFRWVYGILDSRWKIQDMVVTKIDALVQVVHPRGMINMKNKSWLVMINGRVWLTERLNEIVAVFLIIFMIVGGIGFVAFFAYECVQESQGAALYAKYLVEENIVQSDALQDVISNNDLFKDLINQTGLLDANVDEGRAWLEQTFSGLNITMVGSTIRDFFGPDDIPDDANEPTASLDSDVARKVGPHELTSGSPLIQKVDCLLEQVTNGEESPVRESLRVCRLDLHLDLNATSLYDLGWHLLSTAQFSKIRPIVAEIVYARVDSLLKTMTFTGDFFGRIISQAISVASQSLNIVFSILIFFGSLYHLLVAERDILQWLMDFLPVNQKSKRYISRSVGGAVRGVFISSSKMCAFHALFTWLSYSVTGAPFVYISTLLSGMAAIVPIISPWIISVPAGISLWSQGYTFIALGLVISHYGVSFTVDPVIYNEIPNSHPFLTGLSVIAGLYTFDLQGALIGPMLLCLPLTVHNLYVAFSARATRSPRT